MSLPCPEQPWSWTISFSHAVGSIIPGNGLLTRVNTVFTTHQSPFYLLWRTKNISSSTSVVYKADPIHSSIKLSLQMFRRRETLRQWLLNSATGARRTAGDSVCEGRILNWRNTRCWGWIWCRKFEKRNTLGGWWIQHLKLIDRTVDVWGKEWEPVIRWSKRVDTVLRIGEFC